MRYRGPGLPDDAFYRGKAPMTKSEVRAVTISKLRLAEESKVLDIGAGSGSITVEAALQARDGQVWGIERKDEAFDVFKENIKRFELNNICAIKGLAPEDLPNETFDVKGGDCDDLSVCFSSMLEGIGIQTAFVDYREPDGISHVNLLVNTGLTPEYSYMITNNDKKYFIRKNITGTEEIWIPVETTSQSNFEKAWEIAAEKFHSEAVNKLGLAKGSVKIIDIY